MTSLEARKICKEFPLVFRSRRQQAPTSGETAESGSVHALRDISFHLEGSASLGLIGSNGSGKSTLLKVLAGVTKPSSGQVLSEGRISTLLGLVAGTMPQLSGWENIRLLGRLLGLSARHSQKAAEHAAEFSGLGGALDRPVRTYSSGMLLRLGFSAAVYLPEFDILLVDEIIAVGDRVFQKKCIAKMQELRSREDMIFVVATHNLGDIGALCDRIMLLENGRVVVDGRTEDVLRRYWQDSERALSRIEGFRNPFEAPQVYGEDLATIRIEQVRFIGENGAASRAFTTGGPMTICIDYAAQTDVDNPLFRLQFHRNDGVMVHGTNTYRNPPDRTRLSEGRGTIRLHYHAVRLLQGDYYVSVGVWPDEYRSMIINQAFDYHERAYVISVESRVDQGAGIIFQEAEWTLGEPGGGDEQT